MNTAQWAAKGRELEQRASETDLADDSAYHALIADIKAWKADAPNNELSQKMVKMMGTDPASLGNVPSNIPLFDGLVDGKNVNHTAGQLAPLAFDSKSIADLTHSFEHGNHIRTKAFSGDVETKTFDSSISSSMSSLLPAQLHSNLVERAWDVRIADLIPAITADSASYEFLRDTTTGATQAAVVGEGQTKPQVDITLTDVIFKFAKIAGLIKLSREQISDFSQALGYSISQLQRNVISKENQQYLYGDGSTNADGSVNMVGLAHTSGILTHTVGTLATGYSYLDSILSAVDGLRTGAALATPSWAIVHPTTWHAICMQKDGLNRSLVSPDPTQDTALRVWDIPVHLSTDVTKGDLFLADTTKFGYAVVREGLVINGPDHDQDDFSKNMTSWVAEMRANLAVVRPTAVYLLQGLPTSLAAVETA